MKKAILGGNMPLKHIKGIAVVGALTLAMTIPMMPSPAYAATSSQIRSQIADAKSKRDDLYDQAEEASERLNQAQSDLDATNSAIDEKQSAIDDAQQKIANAQSSLTTQMTGDYKTMGNDVLDILSSVHSISDLTKAASSLTQVTDTTTHTMDDIAATQSQLESDKQELEGKKAEQEQLTQQCQQEKNDLDKKKSDADSYINGLNADLKEAITKEDAEANARAQQQAQAAQSTQNTQTTSTNDTQPSQQAPASSDVSGWRQKVIDYAISMVGGRYVYGGASFRSTDCSGLTMQCYAQVGVSIGHSSEIQRSFCTKPISQAVPGDVVYKPGHVGIYIGNGVTVEAFNPGRGIGYGTINRFSRCGSPI